MIQPAVELRPFTTPAPLSAAPAPPLPTKLAASGARLRQALAAGAFALARVRLKRYGRHLFDWLEALPGDAASRQAAGESLALLHTATRMLGGPAAAEWQLRQLGMAVERARE